MIGEDKKRYKLAGGCTAIVSLFILGKLYVANAGDSRFEKCNFLLTNGVAINILTNFLELYYVEMVLAFRCQTILHQSQNVNVCNS